MKIKSSIPIIIRLLLGISFTIAGFSKLFPLSSFISQVSAYQLPISQTIITYTSCFLIAFEIWVGLSILFNTNLIYSLYGAQLLLISMIPITIWGSFHKAPTCGCYGNLIQRKPLYATVEDALLLAITFLLMSLEKNKNNTNQKKLKRQILIILISLGAFIYAFLRIKSCFV